MLTAQQELEPRDYIPRIATLEARCEALHALAAHNPARHGEALKRAHAALERAYKSNRLVFHWSK